MKANMSGSLLVRTLSIPIFALIHGCFQCALAAESNVEHSLMASDPNLELLDDYCVACHNDEQWAGGLSFQLLSAADLEGGLNTAEWEKILRKTSLGEMPPAGEERPSDSNMTQFAAWVEQSLDAYAAKNPDPGRATLRRLNRVEYSNAVRDLLALDIDITDELPADDSGYGFDNIADVLSVSPTLMDRYLSVAGKISRLALGTVKAEPKLVSYSVPKEGSIKNQGIPSYNERANALLPLDSRGGGIFKYYAPYDGVYELSGYLNANTNNEVDRLPEDRVSLKVPLQAGLHYIAITLRKQLGLDESVQTLRNTTDVVVLPGQPAYEQIVDFIVDGERVGQTSVMSYVMRPRFSQANFLRDVLQIDVEGPFDVSGAGDTPSRQKILICNPAYEDIAELDCVRKILLPLARQAYRRPVAMADIDLLLKVYESERSLAGFEQGVAAAIQALLVSPRFLFLHEQHADGAHEGQSIALSDLDLASRLALFLWSSLPDEELLSLAESGELSKPGVMEQQVSRMLSDSKAQALTNNFAGQWLYLRNLEHQVPDVFLFSEFDTRLRNAMKRETEMFFSTIVRENRSIMDFIDADYTYLNEQLAEHYGIDGVKGTAFRKVMLAPSDKRGGLLGQSSILTVTSYSNHTSVVKRGKWILENLLAAPPPPPPPDIPALKTTQAGKQLNAREQMELHRQNPVCSSCHVKMDALGFALEHYDAIGGYREFDAGRLIDASASMPGGQTFEGLPGLQSVLREHQQEFIHAFAERLLTYALGRGLEPSDQPTVRSIVRYAAQSDYKLHAFVNGIVKSIPFTMRRSPNT